MGHEVLIEIAGGVALLLWAARMVKTGVLRAFGGELRHWLGRALASRVRCFGLGVAVSIAVQSSTAVALLLASFAQQGLVGTAAGFIVMLGAGVGSALVVQLLSFNVYLLSPLLIAGGVISFMGWDRPLTKHLGRTAIGLGLLLLALHLIVQAAEVLAGSEGLATVLQGLAADPLLAVLLGAVLGWLSHSSIATVLLVVSLVTAGVVPLPLALPLVLGANLGAALVCNTLTLRLPPAARRVPLLNLANRVVFIALALPLLHPIAEALPGLSGSAAWQVAVFHLGFNLVAALLSWPLGRPLARLAERLLPDGPAQAQGPLQPRHLDEGALERPALALAAATREVMRLADLAETMLRRAIDSFEARDSREIEATSRLDDDVDSLHEAIKLYLTRLSRQALSEDESARCIEIIQFTTNLEHIGDIIDKNLLELASKKLKHKLTFSDDGWREIRSFHQQVMDQMQSAMAVFVSGDIGLARQMIAAKERFRDAALASEESHLARLRSGRIESIETSALHLDVLRDLKRINSHLVSVAYPILDAIGELRSSRLKMPADDRDVQNRTAEGRIEARTALPKTT